MRGGFRLLSQPRHLAAKLTTVMKTAKTHVSENITSNKAQSRPRPDKSFIIRPMSEEDLQTVVSIHRLAFSGFFLSFLGATFLYELYKGVLRDTSAIAFVSEDKTGVFGFIAGTAEPAGFYRRLLRKAWWRFALASLKPLAKEPRIAPRLLRALRKPADHAGLKAAAELMSIAVLPERQCKGVGRCLVEAFLVAARAKGASTVMLTTDAHNNDDVHRFYRRLGFSRTRTLSTPEGRMMSEYVISVTEYDPKDAARAFQATQANRSLPM